MECYGEPIMAQFQVFAVKSQLTLTLIAVAGFLFVLAIVVEWSRRRADRQAGIASSASAFERLAERKGLTKAEISQMYRLAKRSHVVTPLPLATSALRFDEAVHAELDRLRRTADEGDAVARVYSAVRDKLGLDELPLGHALPSTRFLPVGQRLVVGKSDERSEPGYPSEVVAMDDTGMTISWPTRGGTRAEIGTNDRIRVALWRSNDARYFFDTTIRFTLLEMEPRLVLRHTRDITRVQSRKFFRVEVNVPVVLHYNPSERSAPDTGVSMSVGAVSRTRRVSARLTTLSGGGLSMVSDQNVAVDSVLRLHIPLEGVGKPVPVACRVLSAVASRKAGKYVLRAQFIAVDEEDRDRIVRFVSLKQQEQIAEMT